MTADRDSTPEAKRTQADVTPSSNAAYAPLDDVMIAMDVVDTLRGDAYIVERELNADERKAKLIERLRDIYRSQGIEVPDRILEEGVSALEEDRFVYKPPADTFETRLARLYVTRFGWGRYVIGATVGLLALFIAWYAFYEGPRQSGIAARQIELTQTIPERIKHLQTQISAEMTSGTASDVEATVRRGLAAASAGNLTEARAARGELETLLTNLRSAYEVRIVSRRGEVSGLWRVPKTNRQGRNYYLVVEAVGPDGKILPQTILNEENGQREKVQKWAVRVPADVLERVRADKQADGIIDQPVVAVKARGRIEPDWRIQRAGGEITQW